MFKKFPTESRQMLQAAREIAAGLDSPTLEAEHLLLAAAEQPGVPGPEVLAAAGLDSERIRAALVAELEASLATVGVTLGDFDLAAITRPRRSPRWGTSAKLALQRAAKIAGARGDRRITPGHVLAGVLRARGGTVPRALETAGVDAVELGRRVEAALAATA